MNTSIARSTAHSRARRVILALGLLVGVAAGGLGACGTTEGFGKDVKNLGGGIENSAAKNK